MTNSYPWHTALLTHIEKQLAMGRLPHAVLFRHRHGYFDEALGQAISKRLLCDQHSGKDNCRHCHLIEEKNHPNLLFLDVVNEKIGIDAVRAVEQQMWQTSMFDKPKVAYISGMDLLSIAAQNALLKTLEEPPQNAFFILSVENISRVLPTIISRVQCLRHGHIEQHELLHWLQRQVGNNAPTEAAIAKIAQLADNAPQPTLTLLSSPNEVSRLLQEKEQFSDFLRGKITANTLLSDVHHDTAEAVLRRFCRYTENMIHFLFEKTAANTDKSGRNPVQYATWNGMSLRTLYRLYDILTTHRHLVYTNVNMSMQLTTHLIDWQNDRKS
ncbi:MAG: hypothetical protein CR975_06050 [Gammaproteobacteria bacterium]|nr:MAG: hypothetical protein CR975_06050 [Gammaproteobacteria bacterium]